MKKTLFIFLAFAVFGISAQNARATVGAECDPEAVVPTCNETAGEYCSGITNKCAPASQMSADTEQEQARVTSGTAQPNGNNTQTSGFVPLAPIPGLTDIQYAPNGLAAFFNNLYKFLIGLAAALAVIMITWEGLRIATNQDSVSIITDSKGKIYNAIFGLVLVLAPALVFSIINPSILNLSINLPKLDTASGPPPVVLPCDQECQAAQAILDNARQQGAFNLTRTQLQDVQSASTLVQQTAEKQTRACTGSIYKIRHSDPRQNNQCTRIENMQAQRDGYTTCTVLADDSVCLSK